MKKLIAILLGVELLIAFTVLAPVCVLRRDQTRAFKAWREHPTPETRAELDRQYRVSERYGVAISLVMFGFMAGPTLFIAYVWGPKLSIHPGLRDEKPSA